MQYWKEELYHHGILGMKWGRKNGPPYPLAPNKHSASERKAGWQKSLSKNSQPSQAGGGGGGAKEDEDEKIMRELYEALKERAEESGESVAKIISGQSFDLTLAEELGIELSKADSERIRNKMLNKYSKSPTELARNKINYRVNEEILKRDKENRDFEEYKKWEEKDNKARDSRNIEKRKQASDKSETKYFNKDGELVSDDERTTAEKIKGKIFGEKSVTFEEAELGSSNSSSKQKNEPPKTGEKYLITDKGLISESEKSTWQKIKGKIFGETTVTFEDATIGKEQINKQSSETLNKKPSDYKKDSTLKEVFNSGKDWINSKLDRNKNTSSNKTISKSNRSEFDKLVKQKTQEIIEDNKKNNRYATDEAVLQRARDRAFLELYDKGYHFDDDILEEIG